jgi:hypothetical protein
MRAKELDKYPKQIMNSFISFLAINGFEKEIDKIKKLSEDHEVLYMENEVLWEN